MVTLRVSGVNFDVDGFLSDSGLTSATVFRRGQPRLPASKPDGPTHKSSGMNIGMSDAEFEDLDQQSRDALQFLSFNRAELERLANYPGVEGLELDFPVRGNQGFVESYRFPAELLERVGILGIKLCVSRYVPT